ncbi:MAG: T9SS type A sorting domain-containing protein [Bacteroidetes bacterium]|nr:T9SS type A sorting domain-containing protein [Bacteroidota bacterium]
MTAVLALTVAHGQYPTFDITTGASGTTTTVPQSFNETRGVDITVLQPVLIQSIILHRFCTGTVNDSGFVGLRIYDSGTQALLFSRDSVISPMYDSAISFSALFINTWQTGQSFRVSFSCYGYGNSNTSGSGYMFQPTTFPYNGNNGFVQINQAYDGALNTFPNNTNIFVPFISFEYNPWVNVNEIENNSTLSISPNPFCSQTVLQTDNLLHNATLTVDNCFGQTVAQIKNISGQTVTFSRDNLASGLYFVRLTELRSQPTVVSPSGGGTEGGGSEVFTGKLVITDK